MSAPVLFAIFAAIVFGLWTVFHKLGSPYVNQILGAIVVSLTAVIAGMVFFFIKKPASPLVTDQKGLYFLIIAGVFAFLIDLFALYAYSKGLPLSLGAPIIIGGSVAVAVMIGLLLGDQISVIKVLGILLVLAGIAVLATAYK